MGLIEYNQLFMHKKIYIQIIGLALCVFLLFLASNGYFGSWLSHYYPCVQDLDPITSFPCYWIYDLWFSVFVLIVGFVLFIQLGVKLFRYYFRAKP